MILCVTPNPAIDRTLHVKTLHAGEVHRADKILAAAGGKGLNVARTINALGGTSLCLGLIGGHTGNLLEELADHEGLSSHWTRAKNETRTCIILVEDVKDATVINDPGANVTAEECEIFVHDIWQQAEPHQLVCISGSLPPGFSLDIFEALLRGLVKKGKSVWVDTSGTALKTALKLHGLNIKVNAAELSDALGMEISNGDQAIHVSKQLLKDGISSAVVTLGKDGAVLTTSSGTWIAYPPVIKVVSSVGSGDAFLGGLAFALDTGHPPDVSLRHGIAAGAANALNFGGGRVNRNEFEKMFKSVGTSAQL
ncbi:MAG: 1-phosphofructokinase family hexose kinase [Anaerolineae bacterium]|nr:1-phosphofructokinase family hexose kinase [Anaerolineae bacterium]